LSEIIIPLAELLNENQGVLMAFTLFCTALGWLLKQLFRYARNPQAPAYGNRNDFVKIAAGLRRNIEKIFKAPNNEDDSVCIAHFGFAFDYLPLFIALKKGYLKERFGNKPASLKIYRSFENLESDIVNGKVQFVAMSSIPATILRCAGAELRVIELLSAHSQCIITSATNTPLLTDISKTSVVTVEHSSSHFGLHAALKRRGISAQDISFTFTDEDTGRGLFRNNRVSAWAIWPLHADFEIEVRGAREVIGSDAQVFSVLLQVGAANDRFISHARSVRDAVNDAKSWIQRNEAQARRFSAREFGVPSSVIRSAWRRFAFSAQINTNLDKELEKDCDIMIDLNWIEPRHKIRMKNFVEIL
jgi:sulfonate transport system substrate-binding protein